MFQIFSREREYYQPKRRRIGTEIREVPEKIENKGLLSAGFERIISPHCNSSNTNHEDNNPHLLPHKEAYQFTVKSKSEVHIGCTDNKPFIQANLPGCEVNSSKYLNQSSSETLQ